ncbi:MAG: PadR family transcriptional regulator, partial [Chitinophagaceae bacterium]
TFKNSTMNIENTQSQMRKGVLEFCILSIIQRGEAYPSDIIEEMKKAKLNILEGTLYPLLTRLKNADLLNYRWVESSGGPPRKYFSLTEKGAAFYKDLENTWREMADGVERVIENEGIEIREQGEGSSEQLNENSELTTHNPQLTTDNPQPSTDN